MDDSCRELSEITIDPERQIRLSAEGLYQRCCLGSPIMLWVLSPEFYDNLSYVRKSYYVCAHILVEPQQISFHEGKYQRHKTVYPMTSDRQIIQKFREILENSPQDSTSHESSSPKSQRIVIDVRDYAALSEYERMRYYRDTHGRPDLIYQNNLSEVMRSLNETKLRPVLLSNKSLCSYLINPLTVTVTFSNPRYELIGIDIMPDLIERNGELMITYIISDGGPWWSIDTEEDLEKFLDKYLKQGYLYIENSDIIYGYTEEEMEWRIASFREQTKRIKL